MKKNGLSRPFHPQQVLTWVLVPIAVFGFSSLCIPNLPADAQYSAGAGYYLALVGVVAFGAIATASDPTDEVVYQERQARITSSDFPYKLYSRICSICTTHVGEKTKHCGYCNRCVSHFDHHCKWLNNCVGGKNYRSFIALIISLDAMLGIQLAAICIIALGVGGWEGGDKVREAVGGQVSYLSLLVSLALLCLVPFSLLSFLIAFHIYISLHGISTYEFITARQARRNKHKLRPHSSDFLCDNTYLGNSIVIDNQSKVVPARGRYEHMASTMVESRSLTLNPAKTALSGEETEVKRHSKSEI